MEQMQQLLDSAWEMVVNNYLEVIAAIVILVVGRVFARLGPPPDSEGPGARRMWTRPWCRSWPRWSTTP